MKIANILLFCLAVAFSLAIIWAFLYKYDLSIYFIVVVIAYLITTWIYISLKPFARSAFTLKGVGAILSAGCLVLIAIKIVRILG